MALAMRRRTFANNEKCRNSLLGNVFVSTRKPLKCFGSTQMKIMKQRGMEKLGIFMWAMQTYSYLTIYEYLLQRVAKKTLLLIKVNFLLFENKILYFFILWIYFRLSPLPWPKEKF